VNWRHYLFGFKGRIGRARMWLFFAVAIFYELAIFVPLILLYQLLAANGTVSGDIEKLGSSAIGIGITIGFGIYAIVGEYMYAAVVAKRLHDRNRSAWWILVFYVVPFVLPMAYAAMAPPGKRLAEDLRFQLSFIAGVLLNLWGLVELYFLHGTRGDNRFGPDPLAPPTPAASPDSPAVR